jgi:formylglycine-generating enzyme required for sulfatase activity
MFGVAVVALASSAGLGWADQSLIPHDMVLVAHGPSMMGLDKEQPTDSGRRLSAYEKRMNRPWSVEAFNDESPAHMVMLDSYFLDKYEVSNQVYGDFIRTTNHPAPAYWDDPRLNKPEQPVVGVNWYDAKAYCEFRGKRLPTEAEWEKGARGPHANLYPWGNEFDPMKVNFGKNYEATMPVTALPKGASYYGAYNMASNVFEWVADWYDPRYYGRLETSVNPSGPAQPTWIGGTGTYADRLTVGEKRVIRGGSWIAPESTVRATHRFWNHPLNNSYGVGLGFRCAKAAPPEIDHKLNEASTTALIELGRERFAEAEQAVLRGLSIDPKNIELLELRSLIERSMAKTSGEIPIFTGGVTMHDRGAVIPGASPASRGVAVALASAVDPALRAYSDKEHEEDMVHEAESTVDHAWEVYHKAALGGTIASPALQAEIEQHLHEARTLLPQAQEAADRGDNGLVERLVGRVKIHTTQAVEGSKEQKK